MGCHSKRGLGEETQLVLRLGADEPWDDTRHRRVLAVADTDTFRVLAVPDTDTFRATVGGLPTTASVAQQYPEASCITPGDHEQSIVWLLSKLRGEYQMPPLVSHEIDAADNAELAAWIDQLPR